MNLAGGLILVIPKSWCAGGSSQSRSLIEGTEYLSAGVLAVVVLDPEPQIMHVFSADHPPRALKAGEELLLPGILDDFRVRVGRFFE